MTAHKHAELMLLYALDAFETPKAWTRWQWRSIETGWSSFGDCPLWETGIDYRRVPSLPMPSMEPLRKMLVASTGGDPVEAMMQTIRPRDFQPMMPVSAKAREQRRFEAAVAAMQGLLSDPDESGTFEDFADSAVCFADALLARLEG